METLLSSLRQQVIDLKTERLRLQSPQSTESESSSTGTSSLPPCSPKGSTLIIPSNAPAPNGNRDFFYFVGLEPELNADPKAVTPVASLEEATKRMRKLSARGRLLYGQVSHLKRVNHQLLRNRHPVAKRHGGHSRQVLQRTMPQQLGEMIGYHAGGSQDREVALDALLSPPALFAAAPPALAAPAVSMQKTPLPGVAQPRSRARPPCESEKTGRNRIKPAQLERLLDHFAQDATPKGVQRANIAAEVDLPPRAVQVWFQNQRSRAKARAKEAAAADEAAAASVYAHLPPSPPLSPPLSPPEGAP